MKKITLFLVGLLAIGLLSTSVSASQLAKLSITPEKGDPVTALVDTESIKVLFNPPAETAKATPWKHHDIQGLDSPMLEFTSGEPFRLQMDLFFDRYEEGKSVREYTDAIEKLARTGETAGDEPQCVVRWVEKTFKCSIESTKVTYTLFLDDGTPVRAVMNVVFKEFSPAEEQLKGKPRH